MNKELKSIDYGEIKNINEVEENSYGDFGNDVNGFLFCFTKKGWKPVNPDRYEAKYWKKKYLELLKSKQ